MLPPLFHPQLSLSIETWPIGPALDRAAAKERRESSTKLNKSLEQGLNLSGS